MPDNQAIPPGLAEVPYDYAALVTQGSLLFTAGACPLDLNGEVVGPGNHVAQANVAVDNLLAVLESNNAGAQDLVRTTIYVVGEHADLVAVWDTVAERLAPQHPPATLLGVAVLGYPNQLVEIDAIAAVASPRSRFACAEGGSGSTSGSWAYLQ